MPKAIKKAGLYSHIKVGEKKHWKRWEISKGNALENERISDKRKSNSAKWNKVWFGKVLCKDLFKWVKKVWN